MDKEKFKISIVNSDISLLQIKNGLTFGTDALLLSAYIKGFHENGLELGTGTGIISLLLLKKDKVKNITALEVQPDFSELATLNAVNNGLSDRMQTLLCDIRDFNGGCFSANPFLIRQFLA